MRVGYAVQLMRVHMLGMVIACVSRSMMGRCLLIFFFQAEDGIRDAQESRGLGDAYKRQYETDTLAATLGQLGEKHHLTERLTALKQERSALDLSLIHI